MNFSGSGIQLLIDTLVMNAVRNDKDLCILRMRKPSLLIRVKRRLGLL